MNSTSTVSVVASAYTSNNGTCGTLAGVTGQGKGTLTVTAAATQVMFGVQPSNTAHGSNITPAVTVLIEDAGYNVVTSSTATVAIAIGTNPGGGTLSGTVSLNAVAGVATFSTLNINNAGVGYTIGASSFGLNSANSNSFNET